MTINQIVAQAHATALDKGFWEASDNFGEKIALIHSELSEALDATRRIGARIRFWRSWPTPRSGPPTWPVKWVLTWRWRSTALKWRLASRPRVYGSPFPSSTAAIPGPWRLTVMARRLKASGFGWPRAGP